MPIFYIPPPPVTTMTTNANFDGTIHLVRGGRTLCGILTSEMSSKQRWVELKGFDAHAANCKGCHAEKEYRELRARGIKAPKPKPE